MQIKANPSKAGDPVFAQTPRLILVRHSLPDIDPGLPAREWPLSDMGRKRCRVLADRLNAYGPDIIVTSTEPKAAETGRLIADLLGRPCDVAEGLHEHERRNVRWESTKGFEEAVSRFFAKPRSLVFGDETADQAHRRFAQAVADVVTKHPRQNVAIVTHGAVMTLFVSRALALPPFSFWKSLGLPAFVVLSLPEFGLIAIEESIL